MAKTLSPDARKKSLSRMSEEVFDLAIVGGGITGAGVARDAASRGMKVALIEAGDFASGTSSRSSKLIHGGIRYLENLEFHLVFEALSERQKLFDMAPHLVHPLRFILPVYKTGRVPAWKMGLGMWAYDALSLFEAPELHTYLNRDELAAEFPALQTRDLDGGFAYYDAYMDDDRLVLETLRSARAFGAEIVNYVKATGAAFKDGRMSALRCEDQEGGFQFELQARHFVGSAGPWTDKLGIELFKSWKKKLRPSKGVHLTFERSRFPLQDAVVMGAEQRIVFAIPRHEMVIVGTTDTDYPGDPALVRTEAEDVEYLLGVIHRYFPGANITKEDIVGTYAGVRPLIDDQSESESKTSREHEIWTDPRGCTFVAGGKYTTYRNMAEQTVNEALDYFPLEDRARFAHSDTVQPLNPKVSPVLLDRARREHFSWAELYQVPPRFTGLLADRHGLEAREILAEGAAEIPAGIARSSEEWMWCAEALHAVEHTMCLHLRDFYLRRSPLVLSRRDHGMGFVKAVALVMGRALGWNPAKMNDEINALQNILASEMAAIEG
jgi:glycerol-3-phosphate dehydrogenase